MKTQRQNGINPLKSIIASKATPSENQINPEKSKSNNGESNNQESKKS